MDSINNRTRDNLRNIRKIFLGILECSITTWKSIASERGQLHEVEFKKGDTDWSPFLEIDVYSDNIAGLTTTLIESGKIPSYDNIPDSILSDRKFSRWFTENSVQYHGVCTYVIQIECLRYMLIELAKDICK